jgi:hypothetical protein
MNPFRTWRIRTLDGVVVLWVICWIVMGIVVGRDIRELSVVPRSFVSTSRAITSVAGTIQQLANLPVIGSQIRPLTGTVQAEARSIRSTGVATNGSIRELSILLGVAVAMAPTAPLLALYVPLRVSQEREARAFRRALRRSQDDPVFEEFLARRAAEHLPYHRLREISDNPWRDIQSGNLRPLADAELRRVGVAREPRRRWQPRARGSTGR